MSLKIVVIGHKGVVGSATYQLLHRLGHAVEGADLGDEIPKYADIFVICTPEDAVEGVMSTLHYLGVHVQNGFMGLIVIRSTVPIGTCDALREQYGPTFHICHWPEHLREATALWDCYFPPFVSFGECCEKHGQILENMVKVMGVPIVRSDLKTSEAGKLAINNFKAVVISYWNEFMNLGKHMGFNAHLAARIATNDPIITHYGTILGGAYGGKCLPKDIEQTIKIYEDQGIEAHLLTAVRRVNEEVRENHGESTIRTG